MQLNFAEQLFEIELYGKPIGTYRHPNSIFRVSIMYKYNHFHVEVTWGISGIAENIVPILVLDEFDELIERYALKRTRPNGLN